MNRLFSIRTAALVSAVTLVAAWQLSVSGQGVQSDSGVVDAYGSADSGGIGSDAAEVIESASDETPSADGAIFVPMSPAWETDISKLQTILITKPEYLNTQQLQILEGGLENRTESLTEQYAAAEDEARRKELESELAEVVGQHFTVLRAIREREIAKLEQEVARLRGLLQQREDARQEIVQGRVDQLIRSATGMGWDGQQQRPMLDGPGSVPGLPGQRMPGGRPAPNRH